MSKSTQCSTQIFRCKWIMGADPDSPPSNATISSFYPLQMCVQNICNPSMSAPSSVFLIEFMESSLGLTTQAGRLVSQAGAVTTAFKLAGRVDQVLFHSTQVWAKYLAGLLLLLMNEKIQACFHWCDPSIYIFFLVKLHCFVTRLKHYTVIDFWSTCLDSACSAG